jgi:diaminopimelate decarboxylase
MPCLKYDGNELYIENTSLVTIADRYATPCYVYSRAAIENNWRDFNTAFRHLPHRICYAVKANANLAIINLLAQLHSGFDIVSGGELERVLTAGGEAKQIIFSGIGKTATEIQQAIHAGIYCFNVESESELLRLQDMADKNNSIINIALRINPGIDPKTHSYIATGLKENKFGIELENVIPLCQRLSTFPALKLIGIACHIGSQLTQLEPFTSAMDCMINIYQQLEKLHIPLQHIDMGGGLGICYQHESPPTIQDYVAILEKKLMSYPIEIILEPGRAIVGAAGILLTRVEYLKYTKQKNFAIVNAGMNDLIRPALYNAWQAILPASQHVNVKKQLYDVVGPVCESADFIGKDRELALKAGDLLAIDAAGAYGFSMSSNYNSRYRAAEVLVDNDTTHLIRRRETLTDVIRLESMITK